MRLRTLPVSVAGVLAGGACAAGYGHFHTAPFLICLLFALLAQIASNFANEYFDFRNGMDRKGRDGFRRGVTEGDISPRAMLRATAATLALACATGCLLLPWGGWILLPTGLAIAIFAMAYSAGPWPLSHHGLGDMTVVIFFGLVPVMFTTYVLTGSWCSWPLSLPVAVAVGLMAANVLIVNNYRDADDDRTVGKRTSVVILGRNAMAGVYLAGGIVSALLLSISAYGRTDLIWQAGALIYVNLHYMLWMRLRNESGSALNKVLGMTAMLMLATVLWFSAALVFGKIS